MANAAARPPAQSWLLRLIATVLLALILLTAITVLIVYVTVRPRKLVYTIESGSIHNFNLTNNHLNATFNFELRAYNPNSKVSIYYDRIETKVFYDDQTLAVNSIQPFHQPKQNVTHLGMNFLSTNVELFPGVAKNLQMEKVSREVELEVRLKAKIRFKLGAVKNHRTLRLLCAPVVVPFSSSKLFERTPCEVDI